MDFLLSLVEALNPYSKSTPEFTAPLFWVLFTTLFGLQLTLSNTPRWRVYLLLGFSLYFYVKYSGAYVFLLMGVALVDYLNARAVGSIIKGQANAVLNRLFLVGAALLLIPVTLFVLTELLIILELKIEWLDPILAFETDFIRRYGLLSALFLIVLFLIFLNAQFGGLSNEKKAERTEARLKNAFVWTTILINVGLLVLFKYSNAFAELYLNLTNPIAHFELLTLAAPVGISYFCFKSISYVIDVANETIEEPETDYFQYLFYLSFFPSILAGPITRAELFLPQLKKRYELSLNQIGAAFGLFMIGLFKKIVISNYLADNYVNRIFDEPGIYSGFENLMALYSYGIYLFCDFSAYTEMAVAVAMLLGFDIGVNFNEPFKAQNISDFWRRWHISLSTWFADYVFTPLTFGWRRWGKKGVVLATIITFLLSGLWHANLKDESVLKYVLWGLAHGIFIAYEVITGNIRKSIRKKMPAGLYRFLSIFLTFHVLTFSFALFAAKNLEKSFAMYERIFTHFSPEVVPMWFVEYFYPFLALVLGLLICFAPNRWKTGGLGLFTRLHWTLQVIICVLGVGVIYQAMSAENLPFVYLEF